MRSTLEASAMASESTGRNDVPSVKSFKADAAACYPEKGSVHSRAGFAGTILTGRRRIPLGEKTTNGLRYSRTICRRRRWKY